MYSIDCVYQDTKCTYTYTYNQIKNQIQKEMFSDWFLAEILRDFLRLKIHHENGSLFTLQLPVHTITHASREQSTPERTRSWRTFLLFARAQISSAHTKGTYAHNFPFVKRLSYKKHHLYREYIEEKCRILLRIYKITYLASIMRRTVAFPRNTRPSCLSVVCLCTQKGGCYDNGLRQPAKVKNIWSWQSDKSAEREDRGIQERSLFTYSA